MTFIRTLEGFGSPLTISYALSGTASPTDYQGLTGSTSFAPNQATNTVVLTPIDDSQQESLETITVSISAGTGYNIGESNHVELSIVDNDLPLRNPDHPLKTVPGVEYLNYESVGVSSIEDLADRPPQRAGVVANFDISPRSTNDHFGFKFLTFIDVPTNGTYTFYLESEQGSCLHVGTSLVVDNDGIHPAQERVGSIGLKTGKHLLTLFFFDTTGSELLHVEYEGPGIARQTIPNSALHRVDSTAPYGLVTRAPIGPYLNGAFPLVSTGAMPATLSDVGVFSDLTTLIPISGVLPFSVNTSLWSDRATKQRWVVLPTGTTIQFRETGEWEFPPGTVTIKHFDLPLHDTGTGLTKRLETRFMVKNDTNWYGVTYKWRDDESDADLLLQGVNQDISVFSAVGDSITQNWYYPSRPDCLRCHTPQSGFSLGLKTRQLNKTQTYSATGISDNLADLGSCRNVPRRTQRHRYRWI